jgi:integrase
MARSVRDAKLQDRESRRKLEVQPKPHWRTLRPRELHLGYRKRKAGAPGWWVLRRYVKKTGAGSPYRVETLGLADDYQEANGETVFGFAEAQDKALAQHKQATGEGRRSSLTVADAVKDYIAYLSAERKTAADAQRRADALILPELGAIKVAELTTVRLRRWRDALAKKPARLRTAKAKDGERQAPQKYKAAPKTDDAKRARRASVNRVMTILKAALTRAFLDGLVDDDLAWRRLKPFAEVHARRPGHLSVNESRRLINVADEASGFRDLVQAALLSGARYGELCALHVRDFRRGKLVIHQSKTGKPRDVVLNDEGVAFFEQITAGRAGDEIMLPNRGRVVRALERAREQLRVQGKAIEDAKIEDDGRWHKSEQARAMRAACKIAKISPAVGFHQLRHTWCSLSVMAGMPLLVVAHNVGHRDARMVEKFYGHLTESYVDDAIRASAPKFGIARRSNVVPITADRR